MDMSGVAVDRFAVYQGRASMNNNNNNWGFLHTPRSSSQSSMTFQQQQQLLKLLNAHAPGAGAGTGLSFDGAHGNGNPGQQQQQVQHVPSQSYAAAPVMAYPHPTRAPLPPRPAYSSLPAPHLARQQSNPPLLPLPFSRSSSLPVTGPVRQPRNKPAQPSAPRVNVGGKEQQKNRTGGKAAPYTAGPPVVAKSKKVEPTAAAPAKPDIAKQPNVPFVGSDRNTPAAAATDRKVDLYVSEAKVRAAPDSISKGFSLYSLAPHPSSLPLPRLISLKPKAAVPVAASCNAEAAMVGGVDAFDQGPGTTSDDLRRLLRL